MTTDTLYKQGSTSKNSQLVFFISFLKMFINLNEEIMNVLSINHNSIVAQYVQLSSILLLHRETVIKIGSFIKKKATPFFSFILEK